MPVHDRVLQIIAGRSHTIGVARGGGGPPLPNQNATNDKNVKKILFLHFQLLLASSRTTIIYSNIDNQRVRVPSIQFLPTNLIVQPR